MQTYLLEREIQKGARIGYVPKYDDEQRAKRARPSPTQPPQCKHTRPKNIRSSSAHLSQNLLRKPPDHWKRKREEERVRRLFAQCDEIHAVPAREADDSLIESRQVERPGANRSR